MRKELECRNRRIYRKEEKPNGKPNESGNPGHGNRDSWHQHVVPAGQKTDNVAKTHRWFLRHCMSVLGLNGVGR